MHPSQHRNGSSLLPVCRLYRERRSTREIRHKVELPDVETTHRTNRIGASGMQEVRTGGAPPVRFQPVVGELPADFDTIRAEARAEGYRFLDRLASDWASGAMRFDRP